MRLVIPVDRENQEQITSLNSNPLYLKIELDEKSKPSKKEIVESEDEFLNDTDYMIVNSDSEPFFRFFDYSIYVLQAMPNSSVDDILEAFLFKELREVM